MHSRRAPSLSCITVARQRCDGLKSHKRRRFTVHSCDMRNVNCMVCTRCCSRIRRVCRHSVFPMVGDVMSLQSLLCSHLLCVRSIFRVSYSGTRRPCVNRAHSHFARSRPVAWALTDGLRGVSAPGCWRLLPSWRLLERNARCTKANFTIGNRRLPNATRGWRKSWVERTRVSTSLLP